MSFWNTFSRGIEPADFPKDVLAGELRPIVEKAHKYLARLSTEQITAQAEWIDQLIDDYFSPLGAVARSAAGGPDHSQLTRVSVRDFDTLLTLLSLKGPLSSQPHFKNKERTAFSDSYENWSILALWKACDARDLVLLSRNNDLISQKELEVRGLLGANPLALMIEATSAIELAEALYTQESRKKQVHAGGKARDNSYDAHREYLYKKYAEKPPQRGKLANFLREMVQELKALEVQKKLPEKFNITDDQNIERTLRGWINKRNKSST